MQSAKKGMDSLTIEHVGREGLGALVVPQYLRGTRRGHGGQQQRVVHAEHRDLLLQSRPVPSIAWHYIQQVELESSRGGRRSGVRLVRALLDGEFH